MLLRNTFLVILAGLLVACSSVPVTDYSELALLVPQKFELELKDNTPGTLQPIGRIELEYVELEKTGSRITEDKINKGIRSLAGMDAAYSGNTDVNTQVKLSKLTDKYALVVLETYSYKHGAANGQSNIVSAYFDLATGQRMEASSLLKAGYQQALSPEIKDWLEQKEISNEFQSLSNNTCFYQQHQTYYFCFSQYEIAAGSEGVILVPISAETMKKWINPKGLLAQ